MRYVMVTAGVFVGSMLLAGSALAGDDLEAVPVDRLGEVCATSPNSTARVLAPFAESGYVDVPCSAVLPEDNQCLEPSSAHTGEAIQCLTKAQYACIAGCSAAGTMGCTAVGFWCAVGDVASLGTATIPCAYIILASCGAYSAAAGVCAARCVE